MILGLALAEEPPQPTGFDATGFAPSTWGVDAGDPVLYARPVPLDPGDRYAGVWWSHTEGSVVYQERNEAGEAVGERTVLDGVWSAQVAGGYAVTRRLRLEGSLPIHLASEGWAGREGPAPGDLRVGASWHLVRPWRGGDPGLLVSAWGLVPTGDEVRLLGAAGPGAGARLAVGGGLGPVTASAAASAELGEASPRADLGAAVGVRLAPWLGVHLEARHARWGPAAGPTEVYAVAGLTPRPRLAVRLGAGLGLGTAPGTPAWRLLLGVGHASPADPPPLTDLDGDGILDGMDGCPDEPEVADGVLDDDGCPEPPSTVLVLVRQAGIPVEGASVALTGEAPQGLLSTLVPLEVPARLGATLEAAATRGPCWAGRAAVLVAPGPNPLTVDLEPVHDLRVRVEAVDEQGRRLELARGAWLPEPGGCVPEGSYALPGGVGELPAGPGAHTLVLDAPGRAPELVRVDPAAAAVVEATLVPARTRLDEAQIVTFEDVHFETRSATILPRSAELLRQVANVLQAHPDIHLLRVAGHTDDVGSDAFNLDLSARRAAAVVDWLVAQGVDRGRLRSQGFGESQPLAPNLDDAARALNRRVEFRIEARASGAEPAGQP